MLLLLFFTGAWFLLVRCWCCCSVSSQAPDFCCFLVDIDGGTSLGAFWRTCARPLTWVLQLLLDLLLPWEAETHLKLLSLHGLLWGKEWLSLWHPHWFGSFLSFFFFACFCLIVLLVAITWLGVEHSCCLEFCEWNDGGCFWSVWFPVGCTFCVFDCPVLQYCVPSLTSKYAQCYVFQSM